MAKKRKVKKAKKVTLQDLYSKLESLSDELDEVSRRVADVLDYVRPETEDEITEEETTEEEGESESKE